MALYNREALLLGNIDCLSTLSADNLRKIPDRNDRLCNFGGGGGGSIGGGRSNNEIIEDGLHSIKGIINTIRKVLTNIYIEKESLSKIGNQINKIQKKLKELRITTQNHLELKKDLEEQINSLQSYKTALDKEIGKLEQSTKSQKVKTKIDEKSLTKYDPMKVISKDVLLNCLLGYLNLADVAQASQINKEWKSICYNKQLPYKVMLLDKAKTTVVRLPVPVPTLGEYNKARRLADKSSILPFWTLGKIKNLRQQLDEINIQKLSLRK